MAKEKKSDVDYVKKALNELNVVILYVSDLSFEEFILDSKTIDATMLRFLQMAEQVKKISPQYREKYKQIAWYKIIRFRNRIAHRYPKLDLKDIYEFMSKDLYRLTKIFLETLREANETESAVYKVAVREEPIL